MELKELDDYLTSLDVYLFFSLLLFPPNSGICNLRVNISGFLSHVVTIVSAWLYHCSR